MEFSLSAPPEIPIQSNPIQAPSSPSSMADREAIDGLEDDALELSLGLRPAPARLKVPPENPPDCRISGDQKSELQAARRREAMRKRKLKASVMNEGLLERRRKSNGGEFTASFLPKSYDDCSRGSSPGGSDFQSSSGQGGSSSDGGSHSSRSHPPDHATTNGPSPRNMEPCQALKEAPSPDDLRLKSGKRPMNHEAAKGPPDPSMGQGGEALLLSQMPCVSTTGNGPHGRTITGFLYRYTKSEVSIVCVCHGTAFSPAGFVEHSGGVDVENPLRRITVVPFALS